MNPIDQFQREVHDSITSLGQDRHLHALSLTWLRQIVGHRYTHNFSWLGRPIIQMPQDIVAMQELIWHVKPDLVIETGIALGGSLIMSASILTMLDYCEAVEIGMTLDPHATRRRVLGIDIDIRAHNRLAIEAHPMSHRIDMIQGSSIATEVINQVHDFAKNYQRILVCLDSNHTHEHVLAELEAYAPLTSKGSYCVVFDTAIEDMPENMFPDRTWGKGNNPKTAVRQYLANHAEFEIDERIHNKLLISVAPEGYLRRIG